MATNLLQRLDADAARALLARSFAQYQADTGVARLEQRLARGATEARPCSNGRRTAAARRTAGRESRCDQRRNQPTAAGRPRRRRRRTPPCCPGGELAQGRSGSGPPRQREQPRGPMAARGAGRRPAHDRPNRSAVPHGSRADRLSTRCRQPDPSVRRRTLRTVPPATNASR